MESQQPVGYQRSWDRVSYTAWHIGSLVNEARPNVELLDLDNDAECLLSFEERRGERMKMP